MGFTTILPRGGFRPIRSAGALGSVGIIARMLQGKTPGSPRIGLEVVDVRDLADIHIRAMLAPEAAGERFLATGEFLWMADIANVLRAGLGDAAASVPTRTLPNTAVRLMAKVKPELRAI